MNYEFSNANKAELFNLVTGKKITQFRPEKKTGNGKGSLSFKLQATTEFELKVTNMKGQVISRRAEMIVRLQNHVGKPATPNFYAVREDGSSQKVIDPNAPKQVSPDVFFKDITINAGDKISLHYAFSGADKAVIVNKTTGSQLANLSFSSKPPYKGKGKHRVIHSPMTTTTYQLKLSNKFGETVAETTIRVKVGLVSGAAKGPKPDKNSPRIITFTADKQLILQGEPCRISYELKNGDKADVTVPGTNETYPLKIDSNGQAKGMLTLYPKKQNVTYELRVQKNAQVITKPLVIVVTPRTATEKPEIIKFEPNKTSVIKGEPVIFSYEVKNADSAFVEGVGTGEKYQIKIGKTGTAKGKITVFPRQQNTNYMLSVKKNVVVITKSRVIIMISDGKKGGKGLPQLPGGGQQNTLPRMIDGEQQGQISGVPSAGGATIVQGPKPKDIAFNSLQSKKKESSSKMSEQGNKKSLAQTKVGQPGKKDGIAGGSGVSSGVALKGSPPKVRQPGDNDSIAGGAGISSGVALKGSPPKMRQPGDKDKFPGGLGGGGVTMPSGSSKEDMSRKEKKQLKKQLEQLQKIAENLQKGMGSLESGKKTDRPKMGQPGGKGKFPSGLGGGGVAIPSGSSKKDMSSKEKKQLKKQLEQLQKIAENLQKGMGSLESGKKTDRPKMGQPGDKDKFPGGLGGGGIAIPSGSSKKDMSRKEKEQLKKQLEQLQKIAENLQKGMGSIGSGDKKPLPKLRQPGDKDKFPGGLGGGGVAMPSGSSKEDMSSKEKKQLKKQLEQLQKIAENLQKGMGSLESDKKDSQSSSKSVFVPKVKRVPLPKVTLIKKQDKLVDIGGQQSVQKEIYTGAMTLQPETLAGKDDQSISEITGKRDCEKANDPFGCRKPDAVFDSIIPQTHKVGETVTVSVIIGPAQEATLKATDKITGQEKTLWQWRGVDKGVQWAYGERVTFQIYNSVDLKLWAKNPNGETSATKQVTVTKSNNILTKEDQPGIFIKEKDIFGGVAQQQDIKDPSKLTGQEKKIYDQIKKGSWPSSEVCKASQLSKFSKEFMEYLADIMCRPPEVGLKTRVKDGKVEFEIFAQRAENVTLYMWDKSTNTRQTVLDIDLKPGERIQSKYGAKSLPPHGKIPSAIFINGITEITLQATNPKHSSPSELWGSQVTKTVHPNYTKKVTGLTGLDDKDPGESEGPMKSAPGSLSTCDPVFDIWKCRKPDTPDVSFLDKKAGDKELGDLLQVIARFGNSSAAKVELLNEHYKPTPLIEDDVIRAGTHAYKYKLWKVDRYHGKMRAVASNPHGTVEHTGRFWLDHVKPKVKDVKWVDPKSRSSISSTDPDQRVNLELKGISFSDQIKVSIHTRPVTCAGSVFMRTDAGVGRGEFVRLINNPKNISKEPVDISIPVSLKSCSGTRYEVFASVLPYQWKESIFKAKVVSPRLKVTAPEHLTSMLKANIQGSKPVYLYNEQLWVDVEYDKAEEILVRSTEGKVFSSRNSDGRYEKGNMPLPANVHIAGGFDVVARPKKGKTDNEVKVRFFPKVVYKFSLTTDVEWNTKLPATKLPQSLDISCIIGGASRLKQTRTISLAKKQRGKKKLTFHYEIPAGDNSGSGRISYQCSAKAKFSQYGNVQGLLPYTWENWPVGEQKLTAPHNLKLYLR